MYLEPCIIMDYKCKNSEYLTISGTVRDSLLPGGPGSILGFTPLTKHPAIRTTVFRI